MNVSFPPDWSTYTEDEKFQYFGEWVHSWKSAVQSLTLHEAMHLSYMVQYPKPCTINLCEVERFQSLEKAGLVDIHPGSSADSLSTWSLTDFGRFVMGCLVEEALWPFFVPQSNGFNSNREVHHECHD
jgi:hypothetical protein